MVEQHTAPSYAAVFEELGAGVKGVEIRVINGDMYRRIVPLVGARFDRGKVPPKPALWLATRLHPMFRSRERTAQRVLVDRPQNAHIDRWYTDERAEWHANNSAFQQVDIGALDDQALGAHIDKLNDYLRKGWLRHHHLHGYDLGPIGDLLMHTDDWGLDRVQVMALLKGESPATTEAAMFGKAIVDAMRADGVDPKTLSSVDDVRAVPAAAEALDAYLDIYGWRLVTSYDIVGLTLGEMPAAIVSLVRASAHGEADETADASAEAALRDASGHPDEFDDLLGAARRAYGLRDDNGPMTWEWPAGLMRRAFLAAGTRLAQRDKLATADDVFELDAPEVVALLGAASTPSLNEIADRAATRAWEAEQSGPDVLGAPPITNPDLSAMPPGLRRLMRITLLAAELLEPDPTVERRLLEGLGIGSDAYQGIARVADDPGAAIDELEPGDILVAPYTAPSYNAVIAIAGGLVVQEGGLLAHAAVIARELGIPAIVGCLGAMTEINSGDLITIDPVAGTVTVDEPAPS